MIGEGIIDWTDFRAIGVGTLYVLAAVCGMLGGCVAGFYYARSGGIKLPFVLAYSIVGAVGAVVFFAITKVMQVFEAASIHEHILYSIITGGAISMALFTANLTAVVIFKHLGVEVKVTRRLGNEERREDDTQLYK